MLTRSSFPFFIPGDNGLDLTDAQAFIMRGYDTLQLIDLDATINTIPFLQDTTQTYYLIVLKPGYTRYWREFKYNELKNELAGQPLNVTLEPAVTAVMWSTFFNGIFIRFDYWGPAGSTVAYNLGFPNSGYYSEHTFIPFEETVIEQPYDVAGRYFISVKGDIDKLEAMSHTTSVSAVDVRHATDLEGISILSGDIKTVDLNA